jgi:hypothetical protein
MTCMYCGLRQRWPADFPNRLYAICGDCYPAWSGVLVDGPEEAP